MFCTRTGFRTLAPKYVNQNFEVIFNDIQLHALDADKNISEPTEQRNVFFHNLFLQESYF